MQFVSKENLTYVWGKIKAKIPTKISQLTNDSGYLTSHQSLANYYKKTETYSQNEVNSKLNGKLNTTDISAWAKAPTKPSYTASEVGALPNTTTLANLSGDATHRTVTDAEKTKWNNKSDFSGNYNDLTNKPKITIYWSE